jgi:hypothetical protein
VRAVFSAEENEQMFGVKRAFDPQGSAQPRQSDSHAATAAPNTARCWSEAVKFLTRFAALLTLAKNGHYAHAGTALGNGGFRSPVMPIDKVSKASPAAFNVFEQDFGLAMNCTRRRIRFCRFRNSHDAAQLQLRQLGNGLRQGQQTVRRNA